MSHYSIAEAKNNLSKLVHEAEEGRSVRITRRGKDVAILVSTAKYQRLSQTKKTPAEALKLFLANQQFNTIDVGDDVFEGLRAKNSGRAIDL